MRVNITLKLGLYLVKLHQWSYTLEAISTSELGSNLVKV